MPENPAILVEPTTRRSRPEGAWTDWPFLVFVLGSGIKLLAARHALTSNWLDSAPFLEWSPAGLAQLAPLAGSVILLAALAYSLPARLRNASLVGLSVTLSFLVVFHQLHADYYGEPLSFLNLSPTPVTFLAVLQSVQYMIHVGLLWYFADVPLLLLAIAFRRERPIRVGYAPVLCGALLLSPALVMLATNPAGPLGRTNLRRDLALTLGLPLYHLIDIATALYDPRTSLHADDAAQLDSLFEAARSERQRGPYDGVAAGMNVIVISGESLQAFPIGMELDGQEVTPTLNRLKSESLYFENYFDQTHMGTTSDAEFSVLNSLYPPPYGYASEYAANTFRSMATIFAESGYVTFSACSAPPAFWAMDAMHPAYGFTISSFVDDFDVSTLVGPWQADTEFLPQAVEKLATLDQPFFAFWLTGSNHHPFELPDSLRQLKLPDLEGTLVERYLQSVRFFDTAVSDLLSALDDHGLLETTVLVIYGDHTSSLVDEPLTLLRTRSVSSPLDRFLVRKRLPLFIRIPGGPTGSLNTPGGHIDVAPTLLRLAGLDDSNTYMLGKDLLSQQSRLVVFRDGSFINGSHVLFNAIGPTSTATCYELARSVEVDCGLLSHDRQRAMQHLQASDALVRGNGIPVLDARRMTAVGGAASQ